MKVLAALLLSSVMLTGCFETIPEQPENVVVKYKYIVNTIPGDFLEVPAKVPNLDTTTATDKDAAKWLLDKEDRALNLETKLKSIKTHQDNKLKEIETEMKIPKEDIIVK